MDDTYLCQVIENPTRKSNTFDLILANLHNQITHIKLIPGISDFDSVSQVLKQKPRKVPLYKKANWYIIKYEIKTFKEQIIHTITDVN